jgi:lysophospholipase L1-like esterase
MENKKKKIVFLGDSITQGSCASAPEKIYHAVAAKLLGNCDAVNMGLSGTRIARQTRPSADAACDLDYNIRAREIEGKPDCVVVFGGTNDYGHGDAPMGEFGDRTPYTFCGACAALLGYLTDRYGKEKICVILPLRRLSEQNPFGDGSKKEAGAPLCEYVAALLKAANAAGVRVLDLRGCNELNPETAAGAANFADGLHPNDSGHALLGEKVAEFLRGEGMA